MPINKITSAAQSAIKKTGRIILDNGSENAKIRSVLNKVNNFAQGESFNPGRGAYYFLMGGCVILPRLIQAREPDEFREILTRDTTTVLTILFAMKGLKSGMCSAAQKKAGIPLVKDTIGKNVPKLKRLAGYLNPDGGITAFNSSEINSRYSRIFSKDELVNMFKTVDKEGGNIAKMLSVETNGGFLSKLFGRKKETPLFDAAKQMLGEDFTTKTNDEIISMVEKITPEDKNAVKGLEAIVGSKPFGKEALENGSDNAADIAKDKIKEGILNGKNNPITYYARNVAAKFETLSLAITAGFLGFGLPKINEKLTMQKHINKPGMAAGREPQPGQKCLNSNNGTIYAAIKNNNNKKVFQAFM